MAQHVDQHLERVAAEGLCLEQGHASARASWPNFICALLHRAADQAATASPGVKAALRWYVSASGVGAPLPRGTRATAGAATCRAVLDACSAAAVLPRFLGDRAKRLLEAHGDAGIAARRDVPKLQVRADQLAEGSAVRILLAHGHLKHGRFRSLFEFGVAHQPAAYGLDLRSERRAGRLIHEFGPKVDGKHPLRFLFLSLHPCRAKSTLLLRMGYLFLSFLEYLFFVLHLLHGEAANSVFQKYVASVVLAVIRAETRKIVRIGHI